MKFDKIVNKVHKLYITYCVHVHWSSNSKVLKRSRWDSVTEMETRQLLGIGGRVQFLALIDFQCQNNECDSKRGGTREKEEKEDEDRMWFYASIKWHFAIRLHTNIYNTYSSLFLEDQHPDKSYMSGFPVFRSYFDHSLSKVSRMKISWPFLRSLLFQEI